MRLAREHVNERLSEGAEKSLGSTGHCATAQISRRVHEPGHSRLGRRTKSPACLHGEGSCSCVLANVDLIKSLTYPLGAWPLIAKFPLSSTCFLL